MDVIIYRKRNLWEAVTEKIVECVGVWSCKYVKVIQNQLELCSVLPPKFPYLSGPYIASPEKHE